jgi:hypothetical protein
LTVRVVFPTPPFMLTVLITNPIDSIPDEQNGMKLIR